MLPYLLVALLPNFGIMHGNEHLIQKVKRTVCAFIEISLFYTRVHRDERKFVASILPYTRFSTGPRTLLRHAFNLVNLLGIAARCPSVHLLVVGKIKYDVEI